MAIDISDAFVKQYESDVKLAYQRMGSKLRNTVRQKTGVIGSSTTFQKVGKGQASQKTRHGEITTMNLDHAPVECTLADWYAGDYIDKLDELKINIDERQIVAQSGAGALGRKSDDLIIVQLDASTNTTTEGGTAVLTQAKINTVFGYFGTNDVPDDGGRTWVIGWGQWKDLLAITAFSSSDYVGDDQLPFKQGMSAKRWMSFLWFCHSALIPATNITKTFAYHNTAIGHAVGADVTSEINYIPEKVAHLATSFMSQGSILIDTFGVYEVQAYDV